MKILEGKYGISHADLNMVFNDAELVKVVSHFIKSMKNLYPEKFAQAAAAAEPHDLFEKENIIDFQYARLFKVMEGDAYFKEYIISLINDPDYREMQVDEFLSVLKPIYLMS